MTLPRLQRKPRKVKLVKPNGRLRSPKHRAWVRKHQCAVGNAICDWRIDAHHVKTRGAGGGDEWCVSLCRYHHQAFHNLGRHTGVDLFALAQEFAQGSPDPRIKEAAKTMRGNG